VLGGAGRHFVGGRSFYPVHRFAALVIDARVIGGERQLSLALQSSVRRVGQL
jgi:hypothetical protein